MKFSERHGYKKIKLDMAIEEIDEPLLAGLWDAVCFQCMNPYIDYTFGPPRHTEPFEELVQSVYQDIYKESIDQISFDPMTSYQMIRESFYSGFPDTYDFLEHIFEYIADHHGRHGSENDFADTCNKVFEREKACVRFVSGKIAPIIHEIEINEINEAQGQKKSNAVSTHINTAISLYSDRKSPDYRNSVKESISAVEAAAGLLIDGTNPTLGKALRVLEKQGILHGSLKEGFAKLYGWTSDGDGIRHALMDQDNVTEAEARFMLVSCSAFANYLLPPPPPATELT